MNVNKSNSALESVKNLNDFDFATIGALLVGLGDIVWLTQDIVINGFVGAHSIIVFMFFLGNVMVAYGLHIHHKRAMSHRARRERKNNEIEESIRSALAQEFNEI